jgi:pimeloyl-ACP methyl ester carboxylesterase
MEIAELVQNTIHHTRHLEWFRWVRWLLVPLGGYCVLVAIVTCSQRSIMYHPPHLSAAELKPLADRNRLLPWTNHAGVRIGWYRPTPGGEAVANVLIAHGNGGSAVGREYIIDPLQTAFNANAYVLEYPGYVDRPGTLSKESILAAGEEAFGLAARNGPVVLVGESLGTGVCCYLAAKFPNQVRGVVLLVPYDNTVNAARSRFSWLPVRWLLRDKFTSDEWLPQYHGPVVFVVAEQDEVLPPYLGKRLFDLYAGPKQLEFCVGAGHWIGANRPPEFWARAWHFFEESKVIGQ